MIPCGWLPQAPPAGAGLGRGGDYYYDRHTAALLAPPVSIAGSTPQVGMQRHGDVRTFDDTYFSNIQHQPGRRARDPPGQDRAHDIVQMLSAPRPVREGRPPLSAAASSAATLDAGFPSPGKGHVRKDPPAGLAQEAFHSPAKLGYSPRPAASHASCPLMDQLDGALTARSTPCNDKLELFPADDDEMVIRAMSPSTEWRSAPVVPVPNLPADAPLTQAELQVLSEYFNGYGRSHVMCLSPEARDVILALYRAANETERAIIYCLFYQLFQESNFKQICEAKGLLLPNTIELSEKKGIAKAEGADSVKGPNASRPVGEALLALHDARQRQEALKQRRSEAPKDSRGKRLGARSVAEAPAKSEKEGAGHMFKGPGPFIIQFGVVHNDTTRNAALELLAGAFTYPSAAIIDRDILGFPPRRPAVLSIPFSPCKGRNRKRSRSPPQPTEAPAPGQYCFTITTSAHHYSSLAAGGSSRGADTNEVTLAAAALTLHPQSLFNGNYYFIEIVLLATLPAARGQHLAQLLVSAVQDWAVELHMIQSRINGGAGGGAPGAAEEDFLSFIVICADKSVVPFWERCGFVALGTTANPGHNAYTKSNVSFSAPSNPGAGSGRSRSGRQRSGSRGGRGRRARTPLADRDGKEAVKEELGEKPSGAGEPFVPSRLRRALDGNKGLLFEDCFLFSSSTIMAWWPGRRPHSHGPPAAQPPDAPGQQTSARMVDVVWAKMTKFYLSGNFTLPMPWEMQG